MRSHGISEISGMVAFFQTITSGSLDILETAGQICGMSERIDDDRAVTLERPEDAIIVVDERLDQAFEFICGKNDG